MMRWPERERMWVRVVQGVVVTMVWSTLGGLTQGCSGDKCPNTNETPCDTPGLWTCDACGQTWHCAIHYELEQTNVPCECITEDGQRLNYVRDTGDTGIPTNNPACDSRVYEGPD